MNVVVIAKQVPDMNAVKIDRVTGKPVLSGQQVVSSYDAYAIEAAIQLKEVHGGEVTVVTVGAPAAKDVLSRALAMGADRGLLLTVPDANVLDTLAVAEVLAAHVKNLTYDIILAGQGSDDYETNQVGPQLAELLGLPLVSNINSLSVGAGGSLVLQRDIEDGRQTVEVEMPVLLTAISGLNEPRYPSLKGIMAAKKKPLDQIAVSTDSVQGRIGWGEPFVPERTVTGVLVQDTPPAEAAERLVAWLKEQKLV